jgi:hypothetical protein
MSPSEILSVGTMGMILPRIGRGRGGVVAVSRRRPTVWSHAIEEQEDLTEAVEIQEVIGPRWGINLGQGEIIGAAQGDGGMPAVGESDDEVGIESAAEADDLDPLTAERMMRMGDSDESRRRLG